MVAISNNDRKQLKEESKGRNVVIWLCKKQENDADFLPKSVVNHSPEEGHEKMDQIDLWKLWKWYLQKQEGKLITAPPSLKTDNVNIFSVRHIWNRWKNSNTNLQPKRCFEVKHKDVESRVVIFSKWKLLVRKLVFEWFAFNPWKQFLLWMILWKSSQQMFCSVINDYECELSSI